MDQKPRSLQEPILTRMGLALIATISSVSAIAALLIFHHYWVQHGTPEVGRSMVFASFAINSMVYVFGYRSMRRSLLHMTSLRQNLPLTFSVIGGILLALIPFLIPPVGALLGVVPLDLEQWLVVAAIALFLLLTVEVAKFISNRGQRPVQQTQAETQ